jgi:hypothetical protein
MAWNHDTAMPTACDDCPEHKKTIDGLHYCWVANNKTSPTGKHTGLTYAKWNEIAETGKCTIRAKF